ncbi:MAG: hypothetical protein V4436_03890 [Patescibacteria group bacterium]
MNSTITTWLIGIAIFIAGGALVVWFFFFAGVPTATPNNQGNNNLGVGNTQTTGVSSNNTTDETNQVSPITSQSSSQKVFKIANGPVTGAAFVQTLFPTTTYARYVLQENGHVMDQALDVSGSLPRAVSNTTIPGTAQAVWSKSGGVLYLQYLDDTTIKSVSLTFPQATSSKSVTKPVEIQFLPDNVQAIAVSPNGLQIAYLLKGSAGSDGYVANIDGSNSKKLFSIGFSELLLSWPSPNTLLLTTKPAAGVSGMVFSVDTKAGGIVPLIYAAGVTAMATPTFSYILYQSDIPGEAAPMSYSHNNKNNEDILLSFNPIPEKCVASSIASSTVYCATPQTYFNTSYLDNWHKGAASLSDMIVSFTFDQLPNNDVVAEPGSADGGVASDILLMAVSPDEKYLLFVKKGDRSLWGVRLGQN